jgi:hypothetical protein
MTPLPGSGDPGGSGNPVGSGNPGPSNPASPLSATLGDTGSTILSLGMLLPAVNFPNQFYNHFYDFHLLVLIDFAKDVASDFNELLQLILKACDTAIYRHGPQIISFSRNDDNSDVSNSDETVESAGEPVTSSAPVTEVPHVEVSTYHLMRILLLTQPYINFARRKERRN